MLRYRIARAGQHRTHGRAVRQRERLRLQPPRQDQRARGLSGAVAPAARAAAARRRRRRDEGGGESRARVRRRSSRLDRLGLRRRLIAHSGSDAGEVAGRDGGASG